MRRLLKVGQVLPASLLVSSSLLLAGGPTAVQPGVGAFRWDTMARIRFTLDKDLETNSTVSTFVREGFQKWEDVSTARIRFQDNGFLSQDINASNYEDGILTSNQNPVIFDADGSIIEDLKGEGSSNVTLGVGAPILNLMTRRIVSAFAILNGKRAGDNTFDQAVTHEIGHMIGLDHSQANHEFASRFLPVPQRQTVPLMFPMVVAGGTKVPVRDDKAWVSWIYPEDDFRSSTGTIKGTVQRRTGEAFQGANVVAVMLHPELGTPLDPQQEVVSVISDYLISGDGSYELPGLQPGTYAVFIEPLLFHDPGSSVGPFVGVFTNFSKDFYNGDEESGDPFTDSPSERVRLHVEAGATLEGIDVVANEQLNRLDLLGDDDGMTYVFPEGFTFPFFGEVYTRVVVNSDGNLTFGLGDSQPGQARSVERFLSELPRIAPLFTDLDPGKAGEISAAEEPGKVTLTWQNVPEFADSGTPPGNTFSVTLFSTGDILFDYEQVEVTPDQEPLGDQLVERQAIVGITPGNSVPGQPSDLSALGGLIPVGNSPIFEEFLDTSFDLTGRQVFFQVSELSERLLFPSLSGDANNFSAYAVTNFSAQDAPLQVEGISEDGSLLPFPDNPHSEVIDSQAQIAKLDFEFFQVPVDSERNGWVRMSSSTSELGSFFQFGNGLDGNMTKLDGAVAFTEQSKVLYFTRVFQGMDVFPALDPQDAQTILSIANPNDEAIELRITLFNPNGQPVIPEVSRSLPPLGRLSESLTSIFGEQIRLSDGFVRVEVISGPGAVGFELIELPESVLGLNASFGASQTASFSAQMAVGGGFFTSIKIVNVGDSLRSVTVTVFGEDGQIVGVPQVFSIQPNQSLQQDLANVLGGGLRNTNTSATVGSIRVDADGTGVIGDVVFGEPSQARYAAALPLQSLLFRKAIFSHVANGSLGPTPALDLFTGVALFKPGPGTAEVIIRVFDQFGVLQDELTRELDENQRISEVLEVLLASTASQIGGYIIIESTHPLVGQQLFGNGSLDYLSAVPGKVLE
ncbi:MAG: hypothetical protein ACRD1R_08725 [Acidobacteriota bacterium]